MNKEEAKAKIAELSSIIENHNYNYYVLANPTISDYDFDMLLNELIALEQQFPELILPDSPTQRVGGDITKEFQTVKHRYPMLSLSNSYNIEEVKERHAPARPMRGSQLRTSTTLQGTGVSRGGGSQRAELCHPLWPSLLLSQA